MSSYIRYPSNVSIAPNISFLADNTNSQSMPNNAFTKIQFNSVVSNNGGYYDGITNFRFTPLVAGYYNFFLFVNWDITTSASNTFIYLYKNGSVISQTGISVPASGLATHCLVRMVQMNGTTDYVEGFANVTGNGGAALQINGSAGGLSSFMGQLIYQS